MNDFEDRRTEYFVALNHGLDGFKVSYTELTIFFYMPTAADTFPLSIRQAL